MRINTKGYKATLDDSKVRGEGLAVTMQDCKVKVMFTGNSEVVFEFAKVKQAAKVYEQISAVLDPPKPQGHLTMTVEPANVVNETRAPSAPAEYDRKYMRIKYARAGYGNFVTEPLKDDQVLTATSEPKLKVIIKEYVEEHGKPEAEITVGGQANGSGSDHRYKGINFSRAGHGQYVSETLGRGHVIKAASVPKMKEAISAYIVEVKQRVRNGGR